ncbi:MAG: hypothetical protein KDE02_06325, partial [Rhodobacteraceae bacterium]|nr:hypothetical protein [Paracoccaceae bacterium]
HREGRKVSLTCPIDPRTGASGIDLGDVGICEEKRWQTVSARSRRRAHRDEAAEFVRGQPWKHHRRCSRS